MKLSSRRQRSLEEEFRAWNIEMSTTYDKQVTASAS